MKKPATSDSTLHHIIIIGRIPILVWHIIVFVESKLLYDWSICLSARTAKEEIWFSWLLVRKTANFLRWFIIWFTKKLIKLFFLLFSIVILYGCCHPSLYISFLYPHALYGTSSQNTRTKKYLTAPSKRTIGRSHIYLTASARAILSLKLRIGYKSKNMSHN